MNFRGIMRGNRTIEADSWFPRSIRLGSGLVIGLLLWSASGLAVTQFKPNTTGFTQDISQLKSSLNLPVISEIEQLKLPIRNLRIRASRSEKDERIDPVQVYIPRDQEAFRQLTGKLAKPGRQSQVEQMLLDKIKQLGPTNRPRVRVDLTQNDLKELNLTAIGNEMAHQHHSVVVLTEKLAQQPKERAEFLDQIKPYLTQDQRRQVATKLRQNVNLSLQEDLLPQFARRMARRYIVFRGPNCFHAALAFHDQDLAKSPKLNIKEEPGYHRAMINYDELWRIINKHFYEVDPSKSALKYGDMIVFFAAPQNPNESVNFRWIRHTATYLFGSYTFSKGSKSPNTPYSIKTIQEEWATWQGYTSNLGVKIFRRNGPSLSKDPPTDLIDWIY